MAYSLKNLVDSVIPSEDITRFASIVVVVAVAWAATAGAFFSRHHSADLVTRLPATSRRSSAG